MGARFTIDHRLCIAPMMDVTHRHWRYLCRLISPNSVLYTEMITTQALIHNNPERFLQFSSIENPIACQLGGSNPKELAYSSKLAEQFGYDEVNLNVGCPSARVQSGQIGAILMQSPQLVAECVSAMLQSVKIPITVKTRIGVDDMESFDDLVNFIQLVSDTGCKTFIIHARKAWLKGLNPKQNRTIPPLNYPWVYKLKQLFPNLEFIINGGITDLESIPIHLANTDGIMIGRKAEKNMLWLFEAEKVIFDTKNNLDINKILIKYQEYINLEIAKQTHPSKLLLPLLGLFQGQPGAKQWRQKITQCIHTKQIPDLLPIEAIS